MCHFQVVFGVICSINLVIGFIHSYESQFEYLTKELNEVELLATFGSSTINASWFEQPLNHFDSKDNRTWKMRYFERHDLWKQGNPIYLFLGGVGPYFLEKGLMYDLAQETNGALYLAEHRYYGESKPFTNFTTDNLKFLSSRQALADFANLLKYIKGTPKFQSSKVVVVGGFYPGAGNNLATWMKLVYPDLVDAVIASSAPVLAKVDFYEYLESVGDDFKQYGSLGCWEKIAEKFANYEKDFQTTEGTEALKKIEKICDECDMNKRLNQELFLYNRIMKFKHIAEYAHNSNEFREFCDRNFSSKFRNMNEPGLNWNANDVCYVFDFDAYVRGSIHYVHGWGEWLYQRCTEFGYFQTGSSKKQPFTSGISIEFYYNMCITAFGPDFNETRVKAGVQETNIRYGGLKPNVKNVVFVNGDMDPWRRLSILEDLNSEAPAKVISQTTHGRDLLPNRDGDSEKLKEARAYIKHLIKKWIGEGENL